MFREDKGGNPEMLRESQRRRFAPVEDIDAVIAADTKWRKGACFLMRVADLQIFIGCLECNIGPRRPERQLF